MKRLLMIAGAVVALVAVVLISYVGWFLRRAVSDRAEVEASLRHLQASAITIEVVVRGTEDPVSITEISMARGLQEALGLAPPDGFKAEALPLEEREKGDQDTVEYVAKYNREKVRYVGHRTVKPGRGELITFPAQHPTAATGEIQLQHERKVGVGGSIGFVSVRLGHSERP